MVINVRRRCQRGFGTIVSCWRMLVMLQAIGIGNSMRQGGYVTITSNANLVQSVHVDDLLSFVTINQYGFWNHRGQARRVQGRRRDILQQPKPRGDVDSLVLWLLELIMDHAIPPDKMDVTAGEEYATNDLVRDIVYHAGVVRVIDFLGLKTKRRKFGRRVTGQGRGESPLHLRARNTSHRPLQHVHVEWSDEMMLIRNCYRLEFTLIN
jgi:hypothetical protein